MFSDRDLRPVRGMRDLTPDVYYPMLEVFERLAKTAESFGYLRVETPVLEYFEILKAKAGEEVVNEIYYFRDKAGREVGLRFDMTVPIARVVSYRLDLPKPIRWYYITKVWRYDEPQHGRYREFHQYGIELIGSQSIKADAEVITVAVESLKSLKLMDFQVRLSDRRLVEEYLARIGIPDALKTPVLRVLDKRGKVPDEELVKMLVGLGLKEDTAEDLVKFANTLDRIDRAIEIIDELGLSSGVKDKFEALVDALDLFGVKDFVYLDLGIVRGLDYYTGIVFEIYVPNYKLAIGGGGRYDDLIKIYSGMQIPATGFAMGVERIVEVLEAKGLIRPGPPPVDFYIYPIQGDRTCVKVGHEIAYKLREQGYRVVIDTGEKSLRSALEYASRINVKRFIIIGPKELQKGCVKIKDMESWSEREVPIEEFLHELSKVK